MGNSSYVLPVLYNVSLKTWYPFVPENWYTWSDTNGNGIIDDDETIQGLLYPTMSDTPVSLNRTGDAWERNCVGCHVTGLTLLDRNASTEFVAEHAEDGVGCEACHGPGGCIAPTSGGLDSPTGPS